mmetsp:Transcript_18302/g.57701  ORF Transcript_18302/g.57701 Transcript_18302/m.57701 type:complete len:336 (-) Transcript_18302:140-1147(-)
MATCGASVGASKGSRDCVGRVSQRLGPLGKAAHTRGLLSACRYNTVDAGSRSAMCRWQRCHASSSVSCASLPRGAWCEVFCCRRMCPCRAGPSAIVALASIVRPAPALAHRPSSCLVPTTTAAARPAPATTSALNARHGHRRRIGRRRAKYLGRRAGLGGLDDARGRSAHCLALLANSPSSSTPCDAASRQRLVQALASTAASTTAACRRWCRRGLHLHDEPRGLDAAGLGSTLAVGSSTRDLDRALLLANAHSLGLLLRGARLAPAGDLGGHLGLGGGLDDGRGLLLLLGAAALIHIHATAARHFIRTQRLRPLLHLRGLVRGLVLAVVGFLLA